MPSQVPELTMIDLTTMQVAGSRDPCPRRGLPAAWRVLKCSGSAGKRKSVQCVCPKEVKVCVFFSLSLPVRRSNGEMQQACYLPRGRGICLVLLDVPIETGPTETMSH